MPNYTLNIGIDAAGVAKLAGANEQVVIVKESPVPGGSYVAWVVTPPADNIKITWTEDYQVYASATAIQNGATITATNFRDAEAGYMYTLSPAGFDNGAYTLGQTQMGVTNEDPQFIINDVPEITCGLMQFANVNGADLGNPLNAVTALFNQSAVFEPIEKIYVFPAAALANAAVISSITGNACMVDLTENPTQDIHYDDNENQFAPGKLLVGSRRG